MIDSLLMTNDARERVILCSRVSLLVDVVIILVACFIAFSTVYLHGDGA